MTTEVAPSAVIVTDRNGVVRTWSPGAAALFGYSAVRAIGVDVATLIVPQELRAAHRAGMGRVDAPSGLHRGAVPFVMPAVDADGQRFPVELTITSVGTTQDQHVVCVARRVEQVTHQAPPPADVLQALFDRAPEIITVLDRRGNQRTVNLTGSRMLGYGPGSRHAGDGSALVHPDDRDAIEGHFAGLVAGEVAPYVPVRYRVLRGDGGWAWLESLMVDLTDVVAVGGWVVFSRDVSADEERRAALEQTQRLAKDTADRLRQVAAHRLAVAAGISHELRTPLTAISSAVEAILAEDSLQPDEQRTYLEVVRRGSARLTRLIDDILVMSQLDAGTNLVVDEVDPDGIITAVVAEARHAAAARGLVVEVHHGPISPIRADAERIRQAVDNLVGNAVKYAVDDTVVRVESRWEPPATWVLAVDNVSDPISDEEAERIFEPFFRGEQARRRANGSGLGLSVVRSIVQSHGGELLLERPDRDRAVFVMRLPAAPSPSSFDD